MYAQVYTSLDIAFAIRVIGKYLSDPRMQHWRTTKRVMHYLKRIKRCMLTSQEFDNLEIIGYSDSDYAGC